MVSWPYGDAFDFSARFPKVLPLLFTHGFDSRAVTSSSFVVFAGTRESAEALTAKIADIDSGFTVEWQPEK